MSHREQIYAKYPECRLSDRARHGDMRPLVEAGRIILQHGFTVTCICGQRFTFKSEREWTEHVSGLKSYYESIHNPKTYVPDTEVQNA